VTLVVGQVVGRGRISLVCDSKINWDDARRTNPYLEAPIKLIIIRPSLCLGVAGRYDPDQLRHVAEANPSYDELLRGLQTQPSTSFVVACLDEGTKLVRVRNGEVTEPTYDRVWAGDGNGYSRFQAAYESAKDHEDARWRLLASIQHVLNCAIEEVGGFHVRVGTTTDGFRYTADATMVPTERLDGTISVTPDGVTLSASFDAGDPFSFCCCPGVAPTIGACGYFLPQPRLGLLWRHRQPDYAIHVSASSVDEFVAKARRGFGQYLLSVRAPTLGQMLE